MFQAVVMSFVENGVLGMGVEAVIGPAAMSKTNAESGVEEVYFMAGFNTVSQAVMTKLTVPQDMCQMIKDRDSCLATLGCGMCVDEVTNQTYCYNNERPPRYEFSNCYWPVTTGHYKVSSCFFFF